MKLSKLYCNDDKFKKIKFNSGFNVIYADVITIDKNKHSHNLGKSLLIDIIDFMLLKQIDKKEHFFYTTKNKNGILLFEDYIFYLEIELNSGKFLTIRRKINNNTKITFKINETTVNWFNPPQSWDYEDITFDKAKKILADYLDFDFFKNKSYDFRKAINYCLRRQGDYDDIYRLAKFKSGKDIDWKPFMFDLLGFNGKLLEEKYKNDDKIKEIEKSIKEEEADFEIRQGEKDEIAGQIQIKKQEKEDLSKVLDSFNFYTKDKENITIVVDEIENEISILNITEYNIEFDINKLKQSIKNEFSFDLGKIKSIFEETKIFFSNQLQKDYNDLISFNKQLTIERNKLLRETLEKRLDEQKIVRQQLKELNDKKANLLSYIQDTDVFRKFKLYQTDLIKLENEIIKLQSKLDAIDTISKKQQNINNIKKNIEKIIEDIKKELDRTLENEIYSQIRGNFSKHYKEILNEAAFLSWGINKFNNVDFNQPKVQNPERLELITERGRGFTYKKLFCVCFDLGLLTTYKNQSFYRFVYHDDVFANQDNRPKNKLLELTKKLSKNYNLQYIFTIIKDEVPRDENDNLIKFAEDEIILKLHDRDESGTLFGFNF